MADDTAGAAWPSLWRQFWRLIGPQRRKGIRRCPYLPCTDPDCQFSHASDTTPRRAV